MHKTKLIISSESQNLYTTKRFLIEAKKLKLTPDWICPYEYGMNLTTRDNFVDYIYMHRTTGIRYDDFDLIVAKYFEQNGARVVNSLEACTIFRTKDRQVLFFSEHCAPIIPSLCFRGKITDEQFQGIKKISKNEKYILKMNRGNQGIGVNLIEGAKSLKSLLETFHALKDQKFIIQPYIEHSKEWRLFYIQNKLHAIVEKNLIGSSSSDDFRGNAKRSKTKIVKKIPNEIEICCQNIVEKSNLHYCGVDVFLGHDDKFYILEINAIPGFQQVEDLSSKNIAKEILVSI